VAGGTHESGLKDGLFAAIKGFIDLHALLPKGVKLMPEDVFSRASFVLSAKVLDPQFQGQTKERLNSRDALRLVSNFVRPALELWLNQHVELRPQAGRAGDPPGADAPARQPEGREEEGLRRGRAAGQAHRLRSRDIAFNEVFLVEGDSAGGSAKMGRNKETQAVLPLRGKVLNAWEVDRDRLFKPTTRSTTSPWPSASTRTALRTSRTCRACATARSASCPTPTSTAPTSRCCC
jgi:topoisomerase-4 subunit B